MQCVNYVCAQAKKIVENVQNVIEKLEQVRPTKSSVFGWFAGQLMSKSADIDVELAWTSEDRDEQVIAACQVSDSFILSRF